LPLSRVAADCTVMAASPLIGVLIDPGGCCPDINVNDAGL